MRRLMIINMTSAALILWSGMLIITGAVLVLSSQVRHLVDLLESRSTGSASSPAEATRARAAGDTSSIKRPRNAGPRSAAGAASRGPAGARRREIRPDCRYEIRV
jgi:hypothetical protein